MRKIWIILLIAFVAAQAESAEKAVIIERDGEAPADRGKGQLDAVLNKADYFPVTVKFDIAPKSHDTREMASRQAQLTQNIAEVRRALGPHMFGERSRSPSSNLFSFAASREGVKILEGLDFVSYIHVTPPGAIEPIEPHSYSPQDAASDVGVTTGILNSWKGLDRWVVAIDSEWDSTQMTSAVLGRVQSSLGRCIGAVTSGFQCANGTGEGPDWDQPGTGNAGDHGPTMAEMVLALAPQTKIIPIRATGFSDGIMASVLEYVRTVTGGRKIVAV